MNCVINCGQKNIPKPVQRTSRVKKWENNVMFNFLISYFTNYRHIKKNIAVATKFEATERALIAEHLFLNQHVIELIQNGGTKESPVPKELIEPLLIQSFHNCTRMAEHATLMGGRNRFDPFLNLAATLQGLFAETIVARRVPSHNWYIARINAIIVKFVKSNLTDAKCVEMEANIRDKIAQLLSKDKSTEWQSQ